MAQMPPQSYAHSHCEVMSTTNWCGHLNSHRGDLYDAWVDTTASFDGPMLQHTRLSALGLPLAVTLHRVPQYSRHWGYKIYCTYLNFG